MVMQQAGPRGRTTNRGANSVQVTAPEPAGTTTTATRPVGRATRPAGESARPVGKATRPAGESARPVGKATRPAGGSARPVRLVPQVAVMATAVAVYFLVRGATESAAAEAVHNAGRLVSFERAVGLYHEPALQEALAGSAAVRTVLNWIYIWGHWPVIVVTLVWLARRHPRVFRRLRNAMMLSGGVGMVLFAVFPVAPPRLADLGMADTVTLTSHAYRVLQPTFFTNQFAAMPSLHAGWNLLIGLAIVTAVRRPVLRLVGVVLPTLMVVAVVLTANHYFVDVLVGTALTSTCWVLVALPWRSVLARRSGRRTEPVRAVTA